MDEVIDLEKVSQEAEMKAKTAKREEFVKKMADLSVEYGFDIFPFMNYTEKGAFPEIGICESIKKDEVK